MLTIIETMTETMSGPDFENLSDEQKILCKFLYLAGAFAMMKAIDNIEATTEEEAQKKLADLVQDTTGAFQDVTKEVIQCHMLRHLPAANKRPS